MFMELKTIPNTGNDTVIIADDNHKKEYATKGHVNGLAIPALVTGGLALLRQGGLGNLLGGTGGANGNGVASANEITAKEAFVKEANDAIALTSAIYEGRITDLNEKFALRQNDVQEKFEIYKSQRDGFDTLYRDGRDADDGISARIAKLESKVSVNSATLAEREKARERERALEYALINCRIEESAKQGAFDLAMRTCRMMQGEVVLPNTTTVTGLSSTGCSCSAV